MSSSFQHNVIVALIPFYRDALLIPLINCFTSVYAGFAVFAVLGFIAQMKNVEVADVADAGNVHFV